MEEFILKECHIYCFIVSWLLYFYFMYHSILQKSFLGKIFWKHYLNAFHLKCSCNEINIIIFDVYFDLY